MHPRRRNFKHAVCPDEVTAAVEEAEAADDVCWRAHVYTARALTAFLEMPVCVRIEQAPDDDKAPLIAFGKRTPSGSKCPPSAVLATEGVAGGMPQQMCDRGS